MTANIVQESLEICFVVKSPAEGAVPIMSYARAAADAGHQVSFICSSAGAESRASLNRDSVEVLEIGSLRLPRFLPNVFSKIVNILYFRSRIRRKFESLGSSGVIWIGSADAAMSLIGTLGGREYILSVRELYDQNFLYRNFLGRLARSARTVVVPELNRAHILRVWWSLISRPLVIPNKPYINQLPDEGRAGEEKIDFRRKHNVERRSRLLVYQGHIGGDRDLSRLAAAAERLKSEVRLVLVGKDHHRSIQKLRRINPSLIYLGYLNPPSHLKITSLCDIGVVQYTPTSLNNVYCAPNKVWEYAAYSLPVLCAELPPLREVVQKYKFGQTCEFEDTESICIGLREILANIDEYRSNAEDFFNSVDVADLVNKTIRDF